MIGLFLFSLTLNGSPSCPHTEQLPWTDTSKWTFQSTPHIDNQSGFLVEYSEVDTMVRHPRYNTGKAQHTPVHFHVWRTKITHPCISLHYTWATTFPEEHYYECVPRYKFSRSSPLRWSKKGKMGSCPQSYWHSNVSLGTAIQDLQVLPVILTQDNLHNLCRNQVTGQSWVIPTEVTLRNPLCLWSCTVWTHKHNMHNTQHTQHTFPLFITKSDTNRDKWVTCRFSDLASFHVPDTGNKGGIRAPVEASVGATQTGELLLTQGKDNRAKGKERVGDHSF